MPTAAQSALNAGLGVLTSELGQCFVLNGVSFLGLVSNPIVASRGTPRGQSLGPEHDFEVDVRQSDLAGIEPRPGQALTSDGVTYRIVGVEYSPGTHKVTIMCVNPR